MLLAHVSAGRRRRKVRVGMFRDLKGSDPVTPAALWEIRVRDVALGALISASTRLVTP